MIRAAAKSKSRRRSKHDAFSEALRVLQNKGLVWTINMSPTEQAIFAAVGERYRNAAVVTFSFEGRRVDIAVSPSPFTPDSKRWNEETAFRVALLVPIIRASGRDRWPQFVEWRALYRLLGDQLLALCQAAMRAEIIHRLPDFPELRSPKAKRDKERAALEEALGSLSKPSKIRVASIEDEDHTEYTRPGYRFDVEAREYVAAEPTPPRKLEFETGDFNAFKRLLELAILSSPYPCHDDKLVIHLWRHHYDTSMHVLGNYRIAMTLSAGSRRAHLEDATSTINEVFTIAGKGFHLRRGHFKLTFDTKHLKTAAANERRRARTELSRWLRLLGRDPSAVLRRTSA